MLGNDGFSLVEIIVALAITSILMLCLLQVYVISQHNYAQFTAQQKIFKQAEAVEIIFRDAIQHAGYLGCRTMDDLPIHYHSRISALNAIYADDNQHLQVSYVQPEASYLKHNMLSSIDNILLQHQLSLQKNDVVIISDCQHADLFTVENTHPNNLPHPDFNYIYLMSARVGELQSDRYYSQKTTRRYPNNTAIFALYIKPTNKQKAIQLVSGITGLQFRFYQTGKFLPADEITHWRDVQKVKVTFVSRAYQNKKISQQLFSFVFQLKNRL